MATHLRDNSSIESIADVCDAIAAALESDPETCHLSAPWSALTARADELVLEKRKLNRNERRARARLLVADARWDSDVAAFGRAAVDASSGNRSAAPYTRFFNKTTPSAAQAFGYEREIALGRQWITELAREPSEPLAQAFAGRLEASTGNLAKAVEERAKGAAEFEPHRTSVVLLLDAVNRELDITEGELMKLFPGERKRVASYLTASRPVRREREPVDDLESSS